MTPDPRTELLRLAYDREAENRRRDTFDILEVVRLREIAAAMPGAPSPVPTLQPPPKE